MMVVDRIGDPVHCCPEHNQTYYFHCIRCFNPIFDTPTHLRAVLPQKKASGTNSIERAE
jgi:hypothetical protein